MDTSKARGDTGGRDTILYVVKCLAGTAVSYSLYVAFPRYPLYWSIISVLLVLDPDEKESMRLSYARMKANIAGAAVGVAAILAFGRVRLAALCLSVVATLALCQLIKLGKATRSALAALVIVTVSGPATWITGLERMACVVFGCLVAMALNVLTSLVMRWPRSRGGGREA
ncbi:MAG: FUSC family protein [Spirochaetes bacterium]|nr:FUSC family protein [Spirochaetota bacterium]MBU1079912.1 FUSC family protein [Spirochaetota bacterium]